MKTCECGCGGKVKSPDRQGRTRRFVKGHRGGLVTLDCYTINQETGCWEWDACLNDAGYGLKGHHRAHRLMYEKHKGPIPEGLQIDHICRNRKCINPDHLEAVTHAENGRRGVNAKLSHEKAAEIRELAGKMSQVKIAKTYGVHSSVISTVINNKAWNTEARHEG